MIRRLGRQDGGLRLGLQSALVIEKPIIIELFRKEWPATDCTPRQAAGDTDRIRPEPLLAAP